MSPPHTQGARLIYTKYLRQWLLKYQPKIDTVLEKVGTDQCLVVWIRQSQADCAEDACCFRMACDVLICHIPTSTCNCK
jgi:hypothetical protein